MIRRDYILSAIEEFAAVLAKILGFTKKEEWENASATATQEFQRLTGVDAPQALRMSDTELLARLMEGGPTHVFMCAC
jgi:hypothetical protein